MNKVVGLLIGVVLVTIVATLLINRERAERKRLERVVESLRSRGDDQARLEADNSRLSNLIAQSEHRFEQTPSELLRLRGEVGRLRHEAADSQQNTGTNAAAANLEGSMNIPIGATTKDVLSELDRIGAHVLCNKSGLLLSEIITTNANVGQSIKMAFSFEGGKLSSKTFNSGPLPSE